MRFLCEIIKGESQAEHTERESEILRDGERGREKRWRERVRRWFLSKTVIFGFDHRPKSTRDILRYRYWSYLHKVISRRLQILKSLVRRYFYFPTVSGAHDLCSNNSDVFHSFDLMKYQHQCKLSPDNDALKSYAECHN